jgi:hypothetical protein
MTSTPVIKSNKNEAGNILIYILGAIFLLGLLVITSKGSITPGAGIDQETLLIRVSEVQNYGKELERAVAYVLANGHSETDIRFSHPDADSAYGDITNDPTRQVFSREGGGAVYRASPNGVQTTPTDWMFNGANRVDQVGSNTVDEKGADLIAILQNVSLGFCLSVNDKNSITNPSNTPPQDETSVEITTPFTGAFTSTHVIGDSGSLYLPQHLEGCFEGDTNPPAGTYHYYRVLLAR